MLGESLDQRESLIAGLAEVFILGHSHLHSVNELILVARGGAINGWVTSVNFVRGEISDSQTGLGRRGAAARIRRGRCTALQWQFGVAQ